MMISKMKDRIVEKLLAFTGSQRFMTAQLDITNACNLTCAHCYHAHHSNRGALSMMEWRLILDQYAGLIGKLRLQPRFILCGGEPTLSPLFTPMLDELNSRWPGVRITVLTNGTMLNRRFAASMKGYNIGFQVSLDGPDAVRHDLIRGAGAFDRAMTGLQNLQEAGLNASLLATLSHRTSHWIADFFETAARVKSEQMGFTRFIAEGNGRLLEESSEDRPLSGPELRNAYTSILAHSKRTGVPTSTNLPLFHLIDPELGANGKLGFQGIIIDYQGNLKVSSRVSFKLGNILEEGLESLFLGHPLMRALRDREIEGCGPCPHYTVCGGDRNAAFVSTGSFLKKDPACWLAAVPQGVA